MLRIICKKGVSAVFWILIMLAFDSPLICALTLISAAIHECGHLAAAHILGRWNVGSPRAVIGGLKIDTGATISYKEEAIIAAAGPAANLLAALLFLPFLSGEYALLFFLLNLLSCISNLLPLRGYDGARVLGAILNSRLDATRSAAITDALSLISSFTLVLLTLILIMHFGEGYWLFGVFFAIFLGEIFKKHR